MPDQFGEIEFQSLIEQFRVIGFPGANGRIERCQDMLDLLASGRAESTAVLSIQIDHFLAAELHLGDFPASVGPEFLAWDFG